MHEPVPPELELVELVELVDVPEDPPDDEDVDDVDEPDVDEPDDVDDDPDVDEDDDVDEPPLLLPPELVLDDVEPFGAGAFSKPGDPLDADGAGSVPSSLCVGSGAVAHATATPASTRVTRTLAARAFVVVVIVGLLVDFSARTARGRGLGHAGRRHDQALAAPRRE